MNLDQHIETIARRLLGTPNAKMSSRTQLRFGNNGSVAVEIGGTELGKWFDHETEVGGGPLDLLRVKGGVANGEAADWLLNQLGINVEPKRHKGTRRIVAAYDYVDESGAVRYQAVRYEPKDFRQRRPDGKGGWIWNLDGVQRLLYRLPELVAAPVDEIVCIVEGEKDVDRLRRLGLAATCNSEGAGKWACNLGFRKFFAGRDVIILPDNDEPGRVHALVIADDLKSIAKRIRIIELAGLPPKGDVSDWLNGGGTLDELNRLVETITPFGADAARSSIKPWRESLILTERGSPKALLANAITAFRDAPEWADRLAFDAFHQRTMLRGTAPWMADAADEAWTGGHDVLAADWLQREGIAVSPDIAGQAIEAVARESRFHPVLAYLARCRWDGEPRLNEWAIRYLGAADNDYTQAVSARWMIGAVARVHQPGCKADCALILEGRQGLGKSTVLKILGQPWFTDEVADLGTKDAALQLAGVWVLELAELDSMSRGDVSRIKSFMSRTTDRFRPPYARRVVEQPRQCVFAGSVNHSEYLRDETGGRRFWPIACTAADIDGLAAARDQLWAEARDRYLADEAWWLDNSALNTAASVEQQQRYQPDAWSELIEPHVAGLSSITVGEVLLDVLNRRAADWSQPDMNRVARCLRAMGWERRQQRMGEKREWRYYRPSPLAPVDGLNR